MTWSRTEACKRKAFLIPWNQWMLLAKRFQIRRRHHQGISKGPRYWHEDELNVASMASIWSIQIQKKGKKCLLTPLFWSSCPLPAQSWNEGCVQQGHPRKVLVLSLPTVHKVDQWLARNHSMLPLYGQYLISGKLWSSRLQKKICKRNY